MEKIISIIIIHIDIAIHIIFFLEVVDHGNRLL